MRGVSRREARSVFFPTPFSYSSSGHKPLPWMKKTEQKCVLRGKSQIKSQYVHGEGSTAALAEEDEVMVLA